MILIDNLKTDFIHFVLLNLQLLEMNVLLRCRQADLPIVESVMGPAAAGYKEKTGKDVNVKVDRESFLNPNL